tara:strand:- start:480 stop:725 length:246 start_codon:yes stop_codon:yes gene_type:complete
MKTHYLIILVFILTIVYLLLGNNFVVGMQPPHRRMSESEPMYYMDEPKEQEAYPELRDSSSELVEGVHELIIMMEVRNEVD